MSDGRSGSGSWPVVAAAVVSAGRSMVGGTDQNAGGGEAVPDVLSQGGREPGPWPRRVAAAAVLVLATVVIVQHLPRSRPGAARQARAAATVTAPVAASGAAPAAGLAAVPDGITGP